MNILELTPEICYPIVIQTLQQRVKWAFKDDEVRKCPVEHSAGGRGVGTLEAYSSRHK